MILFYKDHGEKPHDESQNLSAVPERFCQVALFPSLVFSDKCSADRTQPITSQQEKFFCFLVMNIWLERNLLSSGLLASLRSFRDEAAERSSLQGGSVLVLPPGRWLAAYSKGPVMTHMLQNTAVLSSMGSFPSSVVMETKPNEWTDSWEKILPQQQQQQQVLWHLNAALHYKQSKTWQTQNLSFYLLWAAIFQKNSYYSMFSPLLTASSKKKKLLNLAWHSPMKSSDLTLGWWAVTNHQPTDQPTYWPRSQVQGPSDVTSQRADTERQEFTQSFSKKRKEKKWTCQKSLFFNLLLWCWLTDQGHRHLNEAVT